jgi:hypothetical protein
LTLEILPAFDLRPNEVVLLELFINGEPTRERLIDGSSPDRATTFVVLENWWRVNQRKESDAREACFHITRGVLVRQIPGKPTSRTKIKGNTYKIFYQLTDQNSTNNGHTNKNDIAERSKADEAE